MSDSYIQQLFANRIGGTTFGKDDVIYKFEKIKRAKRAAVAANPSTRLIDLGVGEPDEMAHDSVVATLRSEAGKPENRGYADNGIAAFKESAARYMDKVYGVKGLNPETEINHSIGSKPALAMVPAAFINPGDIAITTVPGYPVLGTHTAWYGGTNYTLPLEKKNKFLPNLDSIPGGILAKAKILLLNYPNNPTGAQATPEFFENVVSFARKHSLIVVQDAAYAALTYGQKPLSFLSIPRAKEVGIEIHSLSKAYNMTGWRMAFAAGNELVIKAFATVKDNYDSGQFQAIQKASITALDSPEITEGIKVKYERRLKRLVAILKNCGFDAEMPGGTFYLYVPAPKGVKNGPSFASGEDFSQYLIREKLISSVPWDDAGHFIRFSATFECAGIEDEENILTEIEKRFKSSEFLF